MEIKNIVVDNGDTAIKVSGGIKNLSTEGVLSIIVKLYDNDGNVVGEDKKEYTADKALNGEDTFEFSFAYNDSDVADGDTLVRVECKDNLPVPVSPYELCIHSYD